ncbi:cytochrome c oxidase subunit 1 [Allomyces arbusculus]|nr:cytochrome c oxidase subunit 1 [Allomyces arbusculus]
MAWSLWPPSCGIGWPDWDEVLAYQTFKVRDRRLGFIHKALVATILGYIVSTIITKQLYLSKENVIGGSVRTTLQRPPVAVTQQPYCATVKGGCLYWSAEQVMPRPEEAGMFLATRASVTTATTASNRSDCDWQTPTSADCAPLFLPNATIDYYPLGVENFTIMVEHTVRGFQTAISKRNGDLVGTFYNNGVPWRTYLPSDLDNEDMTVAAEQANRTGTQAVVRPKNVAGDIFSVGELLEAAGVPSLDALSQAPGAKPNETLRYGGIVIVVEINYQNKLLNPSKLLYSYRASVITGAESKEIHLRATPDNTNVRSFNLHGIRVKFVQAGAIGQFELISLLTNMVASLALLRLAVIFVEVLMLHVLPERKAYHEYKYQVTEEFSSTTSLRPMRLLTSWTSPNATADRTDTPTHRGTSTGAGANPAYVRPRMLHDSSRGLPSRTADAGPPSPRLARHDRVVEPYHHDHAVVMRVDQPPLDGRAGLASSAVTSATATLINDVSEDVSDDPWSSKAGKGAYYDSLGRGGSEGGEGVRRGPPAGPDLPPTTRSSTDPTRLSADPAHVPLIVVRSRSSSLRVRGVTAPATIPAGPAPPSPLIRPVREVGWKDDVPPDRKGQSSDDGCGRERNEA